MKVYVATKSKTPEWALHSGSVIEVCATGPDPFGDAIAYAKDETLVTGEPTYVFEVELTLLRSMEISKTVHARVHPQ